MIFDYLHLARTYVKNLNETIAIFHRMNARARAHTRIQFSTNRKILAKNHISKIARYAIMAFSHSLDCVKMVMEFVA